MQSPNYSAVTVGVYIWPPEINKCAIRATIDKVCYNSGNSFEELYFILQYLNKPFEIRTVDGTFVAGAYDYQHLMARNEIQITTDVDKMMSNYGSLNISYITQPIQTASPSLLYHPLRKKWQGSVVAPFQWTTWASIFVLHMVTTVVLLGGLSDGAKIHDIYRLSFEQRNYVFWKSGIQKLFIVFWASNTALIAKYYRSQLMVNLVPVWYPIIPYRGLRPLMEDINNLHKLGYIFVLGDSESDEYFFELSSKHLADRFAQFTQSKNVRHVKSSSSYVARNEGAIMLTYDYLANRERKMHHQLCYYALDDVPLEIFSIPYNKHFPHRKKILKAGYQLSEAGLADYTERKYFGDRNYGDGCIQRPTPLPKELNVGILMPSTHLLVGGYSCAAGVLALEIMCRMAVKDVG